MKKYQDWFEQNLTVILFFCAVVLTILDLLSIVKLEITLGVILAGLVFIIDYLRKTHQQLEKSHTTDQQLQKTLRETQQEMQKIQGDIKENLPLDDVFKLYREYHQAIEDALATADEVWVLSRTCISFWRDNVEQLEKLLSRGSLRLMMVDPRDGAVRMITNYAIYSFDPLNEADTLRQRIYSFCTHLQQEYADVWEEKLVVRTIDYLPAWTLVLINPRSEQGLIFAELATFRADRQKRPTLLIKGNRDTRLFATLREEFNEMWKHSTQPVHFAPERGN